MFACYTFFCKKVTSQKIILSHFLFELFIVKRAPFTVHIFLLQLKVFKKVMKQCYVYAMVLAILMYICA